MITVRRREDSARRLAGAGECWAALRDWPVDRWGVAVLATALAGVAIGVPTGIVNTSFYTRMTPVVWWNYPVWAMSAMLVGLTVATYVRLPRGGPSDHGEGAGPARTAVASVISTFAVGCPICNKLVVSLVGVSGALTYWAPLQPILGVLGVVLLMAGLSLRIAGEQRCRITYKS